jgi:hypothetical protein
MGERKQGNKVARAYLAIRDGDTIPEIGRALLRSVGIRHPSPEIIQAALDEYYKFEAAMDLIRERAEMLEMA